MKTVQHSRLLVRSLVGAAMLALAGTVQAFVLPVSVVFLGSGAPPSSLGGIPVAPTGADGSAEGSMVNGVSGINFSQPLLHDQIGSGWLTWSHGYAGNVYDTAQSADPLSVTLNLPAPVTAFYFFVESVNWDVNGFSFTATAQDGATMTQSINGSGGAAGFGFYSNGGDLISSITVTTTDADGFAIGEFGVTAQARTPDGGSTLLFLALGLAGLVCFSAAYRARQSVRPAVFFCALMALVLSCGNALASIDPFATHSGFIYVSVDGLGTTASSGTVRVVKPAGATVRNAYLLTASSPGGGQITSGSITINGSPVTWLGQTNGTVSGSTQNNYWGEVTSIVKPILDAAAAGTNLLTISEGSRSSSIEGEILVVVFDDPNQAAFTTSVLLFGLQKTGGDNFNVNLGTPINLADPSLILTMSLGISYGYQVPSTTAQFSIVKVNGQQMTQSAGGQDDGQPANGALLTVGGIGDTINKAPPFQAVTNFNTDNELYSLIPFVTNGATSIQVNTVNPSGDDNIFFSALVLSGGAVINEGILLTPNNATNAVNTSHTVTASVQDNNGNPVSGRTVNFKVVSGPNAGKTGTGVTGANGKATFTYTGTGGVGMDDIQASMTGSSGKIVTSNDALKYWVNCAGPTLTVTPKANRGYYLLNATSGCVTAPPGIYVKDNGSAFVAGPFAPGTIVKIKKSAATGIGPASGVASVTINILGSSASITAKDSSGATSAPTTVLAL